MKTIYELLSYLQSQNVKLWVEGDDLRYRAPKEILTPEIKEKLRQHKAEILSFLKPQGITSIEPIAQSNHYELSHAQKRLWVLSQIDKDSPAYNIPLSLLIEGDLDIEALQRTFAHVIKRHESLRTTFLTLDGQPRQKVHQEIDFHVQLMDLSADSRAEEKARQHIQKQAMAPFDLEKSPLLRVLLIKLAHTQHVLMVTMHHIISDGWSLSVFVKEFGSIYKALHQGKSFSLPPLPIQYRDYANWQNRLLEKETVTLHRQYWHQKLSGLIPVLNLQTDFPRPSEQTFNGKVIAFHLYKFFTDRLLRFSSQHKVTLFMTLVATLKVLLYRYTGSQEDIWVGTPVAGRNHVDLEGQIGLYLNTLALRDTLRRGLSFVEFTQQVKQTITEAYDHQVYPFDLLVSELELQRDLSRSPLFDVMIILQNVGNLELSLEGLKLRPFFEDPGISKFDLTFDFSEKADGLRFGIEYNTDLFAEERIQRMGYHFIELIKSILANPNQSIDQLKLLPDSEIKQILYEFNSTETPYPKDKTLVDLFELQVEKTPEAVAAVFEDEQMTYQELNHYANQVAHQLQALGVDSGEFVGICVHRSLPMLYGLLGILKAGAGYVPLDSAYPEERLTFMLEDSQVSVVVTQKHIVEKLPFLLKARLIYLNENASFTARPQESVPNPLKKPKPEDSAYVIYTSGSTGKPKGVEIHHSSLVNFLLSMAREPGMTEKDVLMAITTLSFDIAALELYLPLIVGARVILVSRETAMDGRLLIEAMDRAGVTVMQATPSTWRLVLSFQWEGNPGLKILSGGEALPWDLARELLQKGRSVWNLYGPTETTIWSTLYQVKARSEEGIGYPKVSTPIGYPIANTQVYIVDKSLQPVPIGIVGELCIGGDGVANGYLNQHKLTEDKFIPNPFIPDDKRDPNVRLYKTGDLATFLPDGSILFLGRLDQQVKIRGYRIEPGEIETVLRTHPALREAVVVLWDRPPDDKNLAAYVVANSEPSHTLIPELRDFLREKVPDYMVPSSWTFLDALPLTPNGKINRQALVMPDKSHWPVSKTGYEAPQSSLEKNIVTVWQEVLGIDKIGIHDNFFELGGHSLSATRMISRLQKTLGIDLRLIDIFRHPTIAALSQNIPGGDGPDFLSPGLLEDRTDSLVAGEDYPATAEELDMLNEE